MHCRPNLEEAEMCEGKTPQLISMYFLEFKLLPLPLQARLLCQHGVYLSERTEGDFFVALYALAGFYAEVHYRFADSEIVMISSFYGTALLEPYLAKVQISRLLQAVLSH